MRRHGKELVLYAASPPLLRRAHLLLAQLYCRAYSASSPELHSLRRHHVTSDSWLAISSLVYGGYIICDIFGHRAHFTATRQASPRLHTEIHRQGMIYL